MSLSSIYSFIVSSWSRQHKESIQLTRRAFTDFPVQDLEKNILNLNSTMKLEGNGQKGARNPDRKYTYLPTLLADQATSLTKIGTPCSTLGPKVWRSHGPRIVQPWELPRPPGFQLICVTDSIRLTEDTDQSTT
ncbi:hypothetical protein M8J77_021394 [Diaphorina citri]|nr:hypothetical protein M8J77_021394 [Diaphorina citri]